MSVQVEVEVARQQWVEGHRRLQSISGDPVRYERLAAQVDALTEELRRRIGQVFTLQELADEYRRAESWSRDIVSSRVLPPGPGDLATAEDVAFHLYSRAARDFDP